MGFGSFFKKNKEEQSHITISDECIGSECEKCVIACPNNVLIIENNKSTVNNPLGCKHCRICESICPNNYIQVN